MRDDRFDESMAEFFERILVQHGKVKDYRRVDSHRFSVIRHVNPHVRAYLSNEYIIGLAGYIEIRSAHPDVNCIVTASGYNSYTNEAKTQALADEAGLFKLKEFMGALHEQKFWSYTAPEKNNSRNYSRRRGA